MPSIREAKANDREEMAALHRRSIRELAAEEHSPAEIEAWASFPEPSVYPIDDPDVIVLVAERGGELVGLGELDVPGGEIARCYVDPEHAGAGVGRALYDALEQRARAAGLDSLYVESSRNAAGFYERMGFERTGTHAKELTPEAADPVETMVVDLEQPLS